MKIHHLLNHPSIAITNEEQSFIKQHHGEIPLTSLRDRDVVIAQNLVRKGVFTITKDNKNIVINRGQDSNRSII